ncbi:cadherin-like domain-containing protein [Daejeonella sp. JGW-45]|uniref:Ig-like domain-containing protein n=1 Tax=Daejeonella sp. JGW-45 TaxID=3034148 RepID=UPI0023EC3825|nr:cadherin-like domain-containing protein [Daejeonella sp. JGW-45]
MAIVTQLFRRFRFLSLWCLLCCLPVFAASSIPGSKITIANIPPEAIDVKNFYLQSINEPFQILPLVGKDSDGSIKEFKIIARPHANSQGRLMLNGVEVANGQVLTPAQAKQLKFEPKSGFTGTASFTYTVIDNENSSDNTPATFTIPVTNNTALLVCSGTGLGTNILGPSGTFSAPYITPNTSVTNCINNGLSAAAPTGNLGIDKPDQTKYTYASTEGSLGPEGTYSFLKTLGTMSNRNCIKTDWVASDHTGDGGYAMIVNGSPNTTTYGKTFYQAKSISVCPNTLYEFSAYVINVLPGDHSAAKAGTEPNISFYINDQLVSTSGPIAYSDASVNYVPQWVKVGGLWYSGPNTTSVELRIDNATVVAGGNDLGLDDISLAICGPDITYPDIDLTAKFCSYGVLPLKADIKASINTYSAYIFQNSIDGGQTWIDMGSAKIGSPVYNATLNTYEYQAVYGDIPIKPSMDGYRYRLKVATDINNLTGTSCNVSADKVITVSTFNIPVAGEDITGCNPATTAKLAAAGAGETWSVVVGNPAPATIDQLGNISGMTVNGIYKFQLSNTVGCSDMISVTRDEVKSAGADVIVCSPATTVKLADAGTGYKWELVGGNPAAATIDPATGAVAGLTADGIYRFRLRSDYGGCTDEILVTKSTVSLTSTKTDVSCFGEASGSINLSVSGGVAPYTYNWNSGQTTEDISGLAAGSYTVTVTDSKGCVQVGSITITEPTEIIATITPTAVNCYGTSTGSATLTVSGGTGAYTFLWSNGQTTQNATGLAAGNYTVTVTDANGCEKVVPATITEPAEIIATITPTPANCFGSSTGSATLTVSGGTGAYTFLWSNGQTTQNATGLAAGNYTVTITDTNSCQKTIPVSITEPAEIIASVTSTPVNCFGTSTGSATLTVSGGTGAYTFLWSNGQTTQNATGLAAGNYTVTITDANSCQKTIPVSITEPTEITATAVATPANCFGSSTGSATLTVSGGTGAYTFLWSNGQTTQNATGLAAGNYTVTITDANSCQKIIPVTIAEPTEITATAVATPVNCFGISTGSATLTVNGGTGAYTFLWSNGQTTQNATGLAAGNYTVIIRDANGCEKVVPVMITEPTEIIASVTPTPVNCFGTATGSATLTVSGGTGAYTFLWSNGQTTQNATGLSAGNYTVTITDANSCQKTIPVTITEPTEITATAVATPANCFGTSTGSATLTVSGGTGAYTFLWSNGQTTQNATGLAAGNYTVTITDANNCQKTIPVSITEPAEIIASITPTAVNCYGTSTGSATLTISGGTGAYTFLWSNGQTTQNATGLAAGNYTVTITDANSCQKIIPVSIIEPTEILASITPTPANCFGSSTGSATLTVSGGTGAYTFLWSNGQTTQNATGLAAGNYTVTITDANGCEKVVPVTITEPIEITATAVATPVNCYGTSTGSATLTVSGGIGAYTFLWSNGQTTQNATGLAAGNYTVTITDANSCQKIIPVTITEPTEITATAVATPANCFGSSTGSATLTVSGGTGTYTFLWSNGQTTQNATGLAAGNYTVTITDANGCEKVVPVTITEPAEITATAVATPANCFGSSTGSATLTISGGTGAYTFLWSNGQTTQNATGLAAGNYTVTITDANGCEKVVPVTITEPTEILASITPTAVNCFGGSTGSATLTVSGGTGAYTFLWSNGQTTQNATGLAAGNYTVTITDANSCQKTIPVTITEPIEITATAVAIPVNCYGTSTGSATLTVSGGTGAYTFLWSNGQTTQNATGLAAGNYTLIITDANNCQKTISVTITEPTEITATAVATPVNCYGTSTGSATLTVSGGTGAYTFLWSNGQTTQNATGLAAGNYTVTITDANSCQKIIPVTITEPTEITATAVATPANCFGSSTGSATLTVSGGTGTYTFLWSNGQTTQNATGLAAGNYTVTITDANGCEKVVPVTITEPAEITATAVASPVNCFGGSTGSATLTVSGGTGAYSFLWSNGQTTQNATGLAAGNYTVTVTDANGCEKVVPVMITEPTEIIASVTPTAVDCYGGSTGSAALTVSGGTGAYTFLWSNGQTTQNATGLTAGDYKVTITDANSCKKTIPVTITEPTEIIASIAPTPVNCYGTSTGSAALTVSGGTGAYTFLWSNGQTTQNATGLAAGNYTVTITDANSCKKTIPVTITEPTEITATAVATPANCFGASTGSATLTVSGGTGAYTFLWSNGQTTQNATGLTAGNYTVTITDANSCKKTIPVTITEPTEITATAVATPANCFGASTGSATLTVSGGTGAYTFLWSNGQTTQNATGLAAGDYTVTITDANSCKKTIPVTITEPTEITATAVATPANCFGTSTGSAALTVSGGTGAYTFLWSNGQTTQNATGLAAGNYTVTITDANGCIARSAITISQPPKLELAVSKSDVSCSGSNTGAISLGIKGGTAPYTYAWSNGQTTKDLTLLASGNYKVIVTDAANCTASADVSISQPEPLRATLSAKNASCLNNDGSIVSKITGGVTPYKISWSGSISATDPELKNVAAGTYEMLVTDAAGCTISVKAEVMPAACLPLAKNDSFNIDQDKLLMGDVAPNDSNPKSDKLTFTKLTGPQNGKITFEEDGKFTFTPDRDFAGIAEFTYRVCNTSGECDEAKVTINVNAYTTVNLTPVLSSVREGNKIAVTARLLRPFPEDVVITVDYNGKAQRERDYLVLDQDMSLKIPKGALSTTEKITIAALNDGFEEGDEDIILKIRTVSNPDVHIGNAAVVIINDIYPPPPTTDVPQDEPVNNAIIPDPLMSPNNDGNGNEFFTIQNVELYPDNEVLIFNRWGNELFALKNYNNSDRSFKGFANKGMLVNSELPLTDGVYFYVIYTYRTVGNERIKQVNKGYLILKR